MSHVVINGGRPISGTIRPVGSKNAILPLIAASLLSDDPSEFTNVPAVTDVRVMLRIARLLGAEFSLSARGQELTISGSRLQDIPINADLTRQIRGSNLIVGPLLARFGHARGFMPGGDQIGARNMNAHFDGLIQSGYLLTINESDESFLLEKDPAFNQENVLVYLYETSVTATENVIIANAIGTGTVTIENAACEPQIRDVCQYLNDMGAHITGAGTNRIVITKVERLHGAKHKVIFDNIYAASYLLFALVTGGDLYIQDCLEEDMRPILTVLRIFSVTWEWIDTHTLHIFPHQSLKFNADAHVYGNMGICSDVWPKLPSDIMPVYYVLATQSEGEFKFFEKMYENRAIQAEKLRDMGADISVIDPHRLVIHGKTFLHGADLSCPDIRSGIMYLAAMLCTNSMSKLYNVEHIERAYPKIEEQLSILGADIQKYEENH